MEKVLWLTEHVKSGLRSFVLEISPWMMLHIRGDQLRLIAIKPDINWEQSMLYHLGESQHTENIQINKVIGEIEKYVFILWKKLNGLFG